MVAKGKLQLLTRLSILMQLPTRALHQQYRFLSGHAPQDEAAFFGRQDDGVHLRVVMYAPN